MYIINNKSDLDQQQKCFWYVLGPQENKPLPCGRGGGGSENVIQGNDMKRGKLRKKERPKTDKGKMAK